MKKIIPLIIVIILVHGNMMAQECTKKILLTEGHNEDLQCENLTLSTLLQAYDETSAAHLTGDVYLRVNHNNETIADFYIDNDQPEEVYDTTIYEHYLLTFVIEDNHHYLVIEQAQFGKTFALSSNNKAIVSGTDDSVEIEITDFQHEWGYDAPPEDPNRNYFADVNYTLKVKTKGVEENFSFYSSEIKDNYTLNLDNYNILILSDKYNDLSSLVQMKINLKEGK